VVGAGRVHCLRCAGAETRPSPARDLGFRIVPELPSTRGCGPFQETPAGLEECMPLASGGRFPQIGLRAQDPHTLTRRSV